MIDPAHTFARATFDLLMVVHDRQLPPPLSINWSTYSNELGVQVPPGDFLRWLDSLTDAQRSMSAYDGRCHHHATGILRGAPETHLRLTSVALQRQAVA
ncbi:hypothetical protein ACXJJ3_08880 [Kribbella sp. WER1]